MSLEAGNNHPIDLRRERIAANCRAPMRVLYLSDFHFTGRSARRAAHILRLVRDAAPDLILLGGDYADSRAGLRLIGPLAASFSALAPVLAIGGNHDRLLGNARVRSELERAAVRWVDAALVLDIAGTTVRVASSESQGGAGADISLLCLHKPAFGARAGEFDLAFAGHLHGGQVVLWENRHGLFPGRLLYRWNRRHVRIGNCDCFISKGLGDTLPIRYNCRRDMILVDLIPVSPEIPFP